MHLRLKAAVPVILFFFFLSACLKKKVTIDENMGRLYTCSRSNAPDSANVAKQLIGSWKWLEYSSEKEKKLADKTVILNFFETGRFELIEAGIVSTSGSWFLQEESEQIFVLQVNAPNFYTHGRVLICSDELLLNGSYVDGIDNLFGRQK